MWPNESAEYRNARNRLNDKEAKLRALAEEIAEDRRNLPKGGALLENYVFQKASDGAAVSFSQLFEHSKNTLFAYSFMFRAGAAPCSMCVSLLDSLNGAANHLQQKISLAIIARASPQELKELASERGWGNLKFYSSQGNSYNPDYRAEDDAGSQLPIMHVWQKDETGIHHFWASELFYHNDPDWKQQPRHADMIWPLWNVLDLTPQGRGDWYPAVEY